MIKELNDAQHRGRTGDLGDENDYSEPLAKESKNDDETLPASESGGLINSLMQEVTDTDSTKKPISEELAKVMYAILAWGLNEQALNKRKKSVKRPENCKHLRVAKVNAEIWEIAQETTRGMDARVQKLQEAIAKGLVKGLVPLSRIAGQVGTALKVNQS